MPIHSYRTTSRADWGKDVARGTPYIATDQDIELGAILRIADALEVLVNIATQFTPRAVERRKAEEEADRKNQELWRLHGEIVEGLKERLGYEGKKNRLSDQEQIYVGRACYRLAERPESVDLSMEEVRVCDPQTVLRKIRLGEKTTPKMIAALDKLRQE
jgi:hypothetical protein